MRVTGLFRGPARVGAAALALVAAIGSGIVLTPGVAHADTVRELQWYLDTLRIPQAHRLSKGGGVTVAVIDHGVDASHPALKGRVLEGHGIGADADPDGRRDQDADKGHGTGMAGIIAGIGGGDMQQLGIAPEARILPISLGTSFDRGEVAEAIRWAADHGADVINMSLGTQGAATEEEVEAVRYALDKDVVLVASAGNRTQGALDISAPANIPGVIAVTGTTKSGDFFPDSAEGREAVLAAPQEDIISPRPYSVSHNGYGITSGTSDSAAIVSGVVALIRARYPDLDAANVINRLIVTAQDKGPQGRDSKYGFGLVDPVAALNAQVPRVESNPLLPAAASEGEPGRPGRGNEDDGAPIEISVSKNPVVWALQIGFCLLIVAVVVLLIVVNRRAARRRATTKMVGAAGPAVAGPAGPPYGRPPVGAQFRPPQHPAPGVTWPGPAGGVSQQGPGSYPGHPGPPPGSPPPPLAQPPSAAPSDREWRN